jgi:hypothetical protein
MLVVEEKPNPVTLSKGETGMKKIPTIRAVRYSICILLVFVIYSASGADEEKFPPGTQLPQFTVGTSDSAEVQKYLALKKDGPFKISDVGAEVVLIDFTNST